MSLAYLSEAEVEDLLVQTARGRLQYDYDAVRRIHRWTAGHPFLVQLFGHTLFELVGHIGRVDVHAVGKAVDRVLDAAHGFFDHIWGILSPRARVTLAALGERHGRHDLFTSEDVANFLHWRRVQIAPEDVERGLHELTTKGFLVRLGVGSYQINLGLLQRWLTENKPVADVTREVKRYRQSAPPRTLPQSRKPIRWFSVFSWLLSALIVLLIILTWQSRGSPQSGPAAGPGSSPSQVPEGILLEKRIAYARREDENAPWHIYTILGDGTGAQQLTAGLGDDTSPCWSPDGQRILFVSNRRGSKDIWEMNADGERVRNLSHNAADDWTPAWSPQGDAIAFASYRDDNWEIYVMEPDGSRPTRLTHHVAADVSPSWSPDGQRIVFASYRDGNWELYVMNRDGSRLQRLTENAATDFAPAWSPDGKRIAFESYRDGDMEVYVMAANGSTPINLTNEPAADDHSPAWSPVGNKLVFYSNRDGGWDIFGINVDASEKKNLTHSEALEQDPAWQP